MTTMTTTTRCVTDGYVADAHTADASPSAVRLSPLPSSPRPSLRVRTLELVWHCNERNVEAERLGLHGGGSSVSALEGITSIDYHAARQRLVTTGGDGCLRMWQLHTHALAAWMANASADMTACVTHVCTMRTACMPIAARWSPCGEMLASVHCDGKVCLWWRESRHGVAAVNNSNNNNCSNSSGHVRSVPAAAAAAAGSDGSVGAASSAATTTSTSAPLPSPSYSTDAHAATDHAGACAAATAATTTPTTTTTAAAAAYDGSSGSSGECETWKDYRHLSGHLGDVYDVCFSPDAHYLLTGGGDGSVLVHDLAAGSALPVVQLTQSHARFCRGVAWDRWGSYLSTFGAAPPLQYYTLAPTRRHAATSSSSQSQQQQHRHSSHNTRMQLAEQRRCQGDYIGESCALSFRRLSWSPDGALLAVPYGKARATTPQSTRAAAAAAATAAAVTMSSTSNSNNNNNAAAAAVVTNHDDEEERQMLHCVNIYCRNALDKLAARLVVRGYNEVRGVLWAPCFFPPLTPQMQQLQQEVHGNGNGDCNNIDVSDGNSESWGAADYRMALAVWTADAVIVYTTDSRTRHSDFTDLHLHSITDVAWSSDAAYLLTASLDGYVSVIAFGDSLAPAYALPLFSSQPTTRAVCALLQQQQQRAYALEAERSSRVGARATTSRSSGGGDVDDASSAAAATTTTATTSVAVVRKKRKVDNTNNSSNNNNNNNNNSNNNNNDSNRGHQSGSAAVDDATTATSSGAEVDLRQLEALLSADTTAASPTS